MASERTSERAFFGVSALLFAASAAAPIAGDVDGVDAHYQRIVDDSGFIA